MFTRRPLDSPEAEQVLRACECVLEVLDQLDEEVYATWCVGLDELCHTHMNEPLLSLDEESGLYHVNFNPVVRKVDFQTLVLCQFISCFYIYSYVLCVCVCSFMVVDVSVEGGEVSWAAEESLHTQSCTAPLLQTRDTPCGEVVLKCVHISTSVLSFGPHKC